jgi:hypothetical protein
MLAVATSWYLIISATRATYPYSAATNSGVSPAWFCLDSSAPSSSASLPDIISRMDASCPARAAACIAVSSRFPVSCFVIFLRRVAACAALGESIVAGCCGGLYSLPPPVWFFASIKSNSSRARRQDDAATIAEMTTHVTLLAFCSISSRLFSPHLANLPTTYSYYRFLPILACPCLKNNNFSYPIPAQRGNKIHERKKE